MMLKDPGEQQHQNLAWRKDLTSVLECKRVEHSFKADMRYEAINAANSSKYKVGTNLS